MTCYQGIETWTPNFTVPGEDKQYTVQLTRQIGCCGDEQNELFINGVKIVDHGYVHNQYSPMCGGGEYEWKRDGHTFLLMFNAFSCAMFRDHRLFVDGVDVNTGREFSAYWRRRGCIFFLFGLLLFLIAAAGLICFFTIEMPLSLESKIRACLPLFLVGITMMVVGLIPILKFRKPRYDPEQMGNMQHGQTTWPSGYAKL